MSGKLSFGPEGFEHSEEDLVVPSCEAVLSAFTAYTGWARARNGAANVIPESKLANPEAVFKGKILEIAQTLKLDGWDKVPLKSSSSIDVEKLSGATTNAVYVVSPSITHDEVESAGESDKTCLPRKVLLRIYGAQTEYLIDRAAEINVLGRLAQKGLAPRVLGTFTNGRFEEYFSARPLTIAEMCEPETSVQISEQLRELHDGFPLHERELDAGPFIWCIWDKWVERCEQVCTALDHESLRSSQTRDEGRGSNWRERGLVCGTKWVVFRKTVEKYREFLYETYGGHAGTRAHLVFAHNDVKYDNVLRLEPSKESLLAQRSNPLILIDFEYSGANVRGFDFSNHFTEWCYDYNHKEDPTAFREKLYPAVNEQRRFVMAYVDHTRATIVHNSSDASQVPESQDHEENAEHEKGKEEEVDRLLEEATLWRAATSVLWVAWAIVQADLDKELMDPRMHKDDGPSAAVEHNQSRHRKGSVDPSSGPSPETTAPSVCASEGLPTGTTAEKILNGEPSEEEGDAFDYLACAQDRVLVFWGDVVSLGIVSASDLPQKVRKRIKFCDDKRRGPDREPIGKDCERGCNQDLPAALG